MPAQLLDGRSVAARLTAAVALDAARFRDTFNRPARLVVVRAGEDPASEVYARRIVKAFQGANLAADVFVLPGDCDEADLSHQLRALSDDPTVDGILLQLPLPPGLRQAAIVEHIDPDKDVDGVTPTQAGRLFLGQPSLAPNTPAGAMALLAAYELPVSGAEVVIVGRSNIVGKPLGLLMLAANATVTWCHTKTRDLAAVTRRADILCVAAGRAGLVTGAMIKPGAVVVDFGVNSGPSGIVGDVDSSSAA
ncbi:MAG: bifunctional 5,10-methylenetetrahydrofolate dehydrogenase/5,10-methenyltetrahydrofolate cyclohydrolase, partial [Dehalococcoidia bacterium]|nr:bifunctional 5,10-methylenetetrahydrofolate dehydrogenase/5,10-methenyltetrahydrofolate cyclohydrolase [Dehalococcoidia bacterium]